MTPVRRREVGQISFQQILKAEQLLRELFAIDLFKNVTEAEKTFLNKMFNRRHILVHNAGRVDQEYLDRASDSKLRLHQKIVVRSKRCAINSFAENDCREPFRWIRVDRFRIAALRWKGQRRRNLARAVAKCYCAELFRSD